jgi:hypothetical protein
MQIQTIPRTSVRLTLGAARLPLTVAETVLNRNGADEWPPVIAFDQFEATLKQVVGSVFRDGDLVEEGRLSAARVARLREALALEATAHRLAGDADARLARRREEEEAELERTEQELAERRQAIAEDEQRRRREADERRRDEEQRVRAERAEERDTAARKERAGRSAQISKEQATLAKEKRAAEAKKRVHEVDAQIEKTKSARRADPNRR